MADERRIAYLAEGNDPDGPFRAVGGPLLVNPDGLSALTSEGGFALKLTNKTGAASVKGTLVSAHPSVDDAFALTVAGGDNHIGLVYNGGAADGSECWVVIDGRAQALLEDGKSTTNAQGVYASSAVAGRVQTNALAPGTVGNVLEAVSSGTDVLVYVELSGSGGTSPSVNVKAGLLNPGDFGGVGVKQATVTFGTPFPDANYTVTRVRRRAILLYLWAPRA
jgi:hypothetical protein